MSKSKNGRLLILSGLSGSGKSYFCDALVIDRDFGHVPSVTTRKPREGEVHNIDRFFCTKTEFTKLYEQEHLICVTNLFGNMYGNDKRKLNRYKNGEDIVCQLHYTSVADMKLLFPNAVAIYIWPNSVETARAKVSQRLVETQETSRRLDSFDKEVRFVENDKLKQFDDSVFDIHFVNDYSEVSLRKFLHLVDSLVS